jgi:3-oxoacyl-[acyl-carrier-protein] synthase II
LDANLSWKHLIKGISGIDKITSFDTDGFETQIAAEVKKYDPVPFVGLKQSKRMDRFVQMACTVSLQAIEAADLSLDLVDRNRFGVNIASGIGGVITLSQQVGTLNSKGARRVSPFLIPMMLPDMASGQVSMLLNLKGPNFSTVSACSSGADSIGVAYNMIKNGEIDGSIAGGSEAAICPIGVAGFNSCQALSRQNSNPQEASKPFDAKRDGFVLGEGACVLVLEKLENAIDRGVEPIAEILGYAATADAYHITQPAPEGEGGARAMTLSLEKASLSYKRIDYINAHGTSTKLNDKYETMAMKSVFKDEAYNIPISSTKSMTGHLLGASGSLEAGITALSIKNSTIPPTINLVEPDPECDLDYTPNLARRGEIKYAMSNSFGFGGHNASLVFSKFGE